MSIYMQIGPADENGNIDSRQALQGTSTDKGHVGWMPVKSYELSHRNRGTEVICNRLVDGSSIQLFKMAFSSSRPVIVMIEITDPKNKLLQRIILADAVLSRYSTTPTANDSMESFAINYVQSRIRTPDVAEDR